MAREIRGAAVFACLVLVVGCTTVAPRVSPAPEPGRVFAHDEFDAFLRRHVDERGRLDYAAAGADRTDLDRYVARVAAASPDSHPELFPDDAHRLAYWINAYNAWAITLVLEHYPIASVEDVRPPAALFFLPRLAGFFVFQRVTLGGEKLTLYGLENDVVRPRFQEPRIHFALNCASLGCPRLPAEAFVPEALEAQLERETRTFVAEARNVRVDPESGELWLSSIFDWYESDFTEWLEATHPDLPPTLRSYVRLYLEPGKAERVEACAECRTAFTPYDWGLNDQHPVDRG